MTHARPSPRCSFRTNPSRSPPIPMSRTGSPSPPSVRRLPVPAHSVATMRVRGIVPIPVALQTVPSRPNPCAFCFRCGGFGVALARVPNGFSPNAFRPSLPHRPARPSGYEPGSKPSPSPLAVLRRPASATTSRCRRAAPPCSAACSTSRCRPHQPQR